MKYKILAIDDDEKILRLIANTLKANNFHVETRKNIEEINICDFTGFDLILLDVMMPISGLEICRSIRSQIATPILFLTAKDFEEDLLKGIQAGADDYITKPFEMIELLARVETVLRRYHKVGGTFEIFDTVIDVSSRTVTQNGKQIMLTLKEFELLLFFVRNKNIALYRETIYENIWENDYMGDSRTVDLHVQRLRKKMNWGNRIKSVYKVGYRLEV